MTFVARTGDQSTAPLSLWERATDTDPAWSVTLPRGPAAQRVAESLGTLANGHLGTRAAVEHASPGRIPLVVANGIYTAGRDPSLLPAPLWANLDISDDDMGDASERTLDLRHGLLVSSPSGAGHPLRTIRFISIDRPYALVLWTAGLPASSGGTPLQRPRPVKMGSSQANVVYETQRRGSVLLARTSEPGGANIVMAARDRSVACPVGTPGGQMTLERLVAWAASPRGPADWDLAAERLAELEQIGADQLLIEHQDAWEERWADAEVIIEGAPDDELAARFATFHLLASVPEAGEAAVGARGLSGPAYGGHVFWDADVFVLPALAAIRPAAARAMLEYRLARLSAAHTRALETGATGARFPWESAGDGTEVTPREARHPNGDVVPILTGDQEEHIVADIAWAARHYASWTGDIGFVHAAGRPLIVDTARYWAGRIRIDRDGHGHLDTVIGPDEYHEAVDDNAFTNVMARWNLRRGAELLVDDPCEPGDDELARHWHELAEGLVDGWDPDRGLYEQFSGYFELEPLLAADVAPPPFAADLMLGRERVTTSQLIKQADVIMLHHLVPDELVDDSLPADLAFYEPRTAHGSSLSPAVHAAAFARAGQPDRALQLFRMASRLDLDDLTGTTAGGLHLAAMGGVWQALAYGFLGLRAEGDVLRIDPHLPGAWDALSMRVRFRGRPITIRADHISITVTSETPIAVRIGSDSVEQLCAASTRHLLPERASEEASAGNIR